MEAMSCSTGQQSPTLSADELLELLGDDDGENFLELEVASLVGDESTGAAGPPAPDSIFTFPSDNCTDMPNIPTSLQQEILVKKKSSSMRQRDEVAQLQIQVTELEAHLRGLQGTNRVSGAPRYCSSSNTTGFDLSIQKAALSLSFWRVVAQRQLHERHQAEQENAELRKMLREQALLAKSLERMIRKRPLLLKAQQETHSRRREAITSLKDAEVFQVLLSNVEERMRTVETFLFEQNLTPATTELNSIVIFAKGQHQDAHIECTKARVMPFNLRVLAQAMWTQLRMSDLVLGAAKSHSHVLKHTDELLITKHTIPVTESPFGTVAVFSVCKRVIKADKVLLVWERMVECTGLVARGYPTIYLSIHGCGQLMSMATSGEDQQPASTLFHSHARLVPVFIRSDSQQQEFDYKVFIDNVLAAHQWNAQKFLFFVQTAAAGGSTST
ncbi:hypothetical protein Gpo141_00008034 [Globisporangium polare]